MLRTRVLHPRWLTTVLIFWVAAWLTLPSPADSAPMPPARSAESVGPAVDAAARGLGERTLRQTLMAQGLTAADVDVVLARLSPAEQAELARRVGEAEVGGDGGFLIIVLIVVVAILLYLPMAGRMQGWW
jgi:hypothetical protein